MGHSTSKVACLCGKEQCHQIEIELLNARIKDLEADVLHLRSTNVDANEHSRTEHQERKEEVSKVDNSHQQDTLRARSFKSNRVDKQSKISKKEMVLTNQLNSDLANIRVIFQYIEVLESNLAKARKEVEAGAKTFKELEMEKAASWAATADFLNLEERIRLQDPLFKVGVAIRKRFIEQAKVFWSQTDPFLDDGVDQSAIAAGNEAAHGGNVKADTSLFELQLIDVDYHEKHFRRLYNYPWYECRVWDPWNPAIIAMRNFHGTMSSYGASNRSSSLPKSLDSRSSLLWISATRLNTNIEISGHDEFTLPLSRRKDLDKSLTEMREMTEEVMRLGRARREADRTRQVAERAKKAEERAKWEAEKTKRYAEWNEKKRE